MAKFVYKTHEHSSRIWFYSIKKYRNYCARAENDERIVENRYFAFTDILSKLFMKVHLNIIVFDE